jgi:hypothetical protein
MTPQEPLPYTASDHDRLIHLETLMAEVHRAVVGNGQPGLITRVAKAEEGLTQVRSDLEVYTLEKVDEVRRDTPSKGGQRFTQVTAAVAFLAAVWQGLQELFKS